jgi:hypothetical protein
MADVLELVAGQEYRESRGVTTIGGARGGPTRVVKLLEGGLGMGPRAKSAGVHRSRG